MKEVKQPKKPLIFYYLIVLIIIMVLNFIFVPWFAERSIEEVDYGTFISMTDDKKIDEVDIEAQSNVIYFTGKDDKKVYKTAMVSDENLTERLYKSGAQVLQVRRSSRHHRYSVLYSVGSCLYLYSHYLEECLPIR